MLNEHCLIGISFIGVSLNCGDSKYQAIRYFSLEAEFELCELGAHTTAYDSVPKRCPISDWLITISKPRHQFFGRNISIGRSNVHIFNCLQLKPLCWVADLWIVQRYSITLAYSVCDRQHDGYASRNGRVIGASPDPKADYGITRREGARDDG